MDELVFDVSSVSISSSHRRNTRLRMDINQFTIQGMPIVTIPKEAVEKIVYWHGNRMSTNVSITMIKQFQFDQALVTGKPENHIFIAVDDHEKKMYKELKSEKRFIPTKISLQELNTYGIKSMYIGRLPFCSGEVVADTVSFSFNGIMPAPFMEVYDLNVTQNDISFIKYCNNDGITHMFIALSVNCWKEIEKYFAKEFSQSPLFSFLILTPIEEYKYIYVAVNDPSMELYRILSVYSRISGKEIPLGNTKPVIRIPDKESKKVTSCVLVETVPSPSISSAAALPVVTDPIGQEEEVQREEVDMRDSEINELNLVKLFERAVEFKEIDIQNEKIAFSATLAYDEQWPVALIRLRDKHMRNRIKELESHFKKYPEGQSNGNKRPRTE